MGISQKIHSEIQIYVQKLEQYADRIWYPPLISLLAALDNFIVIIPTDGILIASSMLIPKHWAIYAINVAIGSSIGALAIGLLVEYQGLPWILEFYPGIDTSDMWVWTEKFFGKYGLLFVFAIGLTPLMQQPVIILAALSNPTLLSFAAVIFAGRLIKYMTMAFIGSHSPRLLKKMWGVKDELKDAGIKID
jgi:membrane protein YqaA with SNARE-associated domain